jgi:UDP-glucose 4-epimerase
VIKTTQSRSHVQLTPYSEAYPKGFEDLRQRQPDLTRIRAAIGFSPRIALEQTIRDVAAWLREGQP